MSVRCTNQQGDDLELTAFDGRFFDLISPKAFAPGQPLVLSARLEPSSCTLDLKSIGSRRRDDGRYDVRARATTLARGTRERITAALAPAD